MGILVEKNEKFTVITVDDISLAGDLSADFKKKAVEVIESGIININLDLSKTEFIDSSGVGKLLFLNKKLEKAEGKLKISAISNVLYDFLDSLAITRVIEISSPL